LAKGSDYTIIGKPEKISDYLSPIVTQDIQSILILPIWVKDRLEAILCFGYRDPSDISSENTLLGRQFADQISVGLSNSNLIQDLKELNWGTLQALARTVDAKSAWTAGHSQRVTEIALKIGWAMQLNPKALEELRCAGLLHDIGKVGIPSKILDKSSHLTAEQFSIIKRHSVLGAKIIEPIKTFREVVPIVAQHHERIDGKGYPDGLTGDEIHIGAKILAVADAFDAMLSDRPYRKGLPLYETLHRIKQSKGRQFDANVVNALMNIIKTQRKNVDYPTTATNVGAVY
jgi:putative nucleotidyltransferase with HDIG domain